MKTKRMLALFLSILLMVTCLPLTSQAAAAKMNKKSATILVSKTVQLKVLNTKKTVKWSTSSKKVATVSKKGLVTGKKVGKATITAKVGKKKYTCKVTVKAGLNETKKSLVTGSTTQLKVLGASKATWKSSSTKVATVSKTGKVTAKTAGTAKITAKVGKKTYTCTITVKAKLNATSKTLKEGDFYKLTLKGAAKTVTWTSSAPSVATVSKSGKVTAKTAGTATITAKDGSTKYTCKITVKGKTVVDDKNDNKVDTPTKKVEDYTDFIVDVEAGREIRVLQLTDTQIIDAAQERPGRGGVDYKNWATDKMDERCFNYIKKTIENTNPDLILMTGDLVYGEFDDKGTSLQALIAYMDTFGIPWAPVFGNHENESYKGVDWQCQQLEASKYCLFKQRTLTGNGNYTVGVRQGGVVKRVFFMMDSNGCGAASDQSMSNGHTKKTAGFGDDQIAWYMETAHAMKEAQPNLKLSFAFHIQTAIFEDAFKKYGFDSSKVVSSNILKNPVNIDTIKDKAETDFGYLGRGLKGPWDYTDTVWDSFQELGVDSIFVGHEHCNSGSAIYQGVRFQYGQKTGTYDRANYVTASGTIEGSYNCEIGTPIVGGTLIPLAEADGSITQPYIFYCEKIDLPQEPDDSDTPKITVNGLQNGEGLTPSGEISVSAATVGGENAWKCVANAQGKVFVSEDLLKNKKSVTFSVYLATPGVALLLGGDPEFAIRVKPNDLEPDMDGSPNGYIEYGTKATDENRKLIANTWQSFTVDISGFGTSCTEFAFNLPKGAILYLKDVAVQ